MKRLFTFVAALVCAAASFAQVSIWNGSSDLWTRGAGTQVSPFQIESAEQLAFIAEMVNAGVTTYENTYFKLMTNIDLNNLTWVPIGSSETNCFKGHIDGNNKTIFNNSNSLFQFCNSASVKKISIEMSGIASYAENCEFKNVFYKGDTTMVIGAKKSLFNNCLSNIEVRSQSKEIAGLVGIAERCKFISCSMKGNIVGQYIYISNQDSNKNLYAAGITAKSSNCSYFQCSCIGNIHAWGGTKTYGVTTFFGFSGGIVGFSCQDTIDYCSALGNITGPTDSYYGGAGGIIGIISNKYISGTGYVQSFINNSYTITDKLYHTVGYSQFAHDGYELNAGNTGTPTIVNSYSGSDKTEAAMKSVSFPIILNTDSTVFIKDDYGVNDGYPIYKNQVYPVTSVADNINFTSAQLNGSLYAENADSIGFEFKEKADATHWYRSVTANPSSTPVSHTISDLTAGTEYVFRLWAEKEGVRYFGDTVTFTTLECSQDITPITATICNGEEYTWANQILTQAGPYRDTLTSSLGCDSIVELTLTVLPTNDLNKYDTIPTGETYDFYGEILNETGIYYHYVPAGTYCNLVILHLQVGESGETALDILTDDSTIPYKVLQEGQIYILRGDKTYTLTGAEVK